MAFVTLTDLDGRRVRAELLSQSGEQQWVRLEDAQTLSLPKSALEAQPSGDYRLLMTLSELETLSAAEKPGEVGATGEDEDIVIPVAEEQLIVRKQQVQGARVRVTKTVHEEERVVDEPLVSEEVAVERVKVERLVNAPEPIRSEGDTTVIPLYEEVLVIEKRLMLTEEVRVTKRRSEKREPQRVSLRHEEVSVERVEPDKGVMKDKG